MFSTWLRWGKARFAAPLVLSPRDRGRGEATRSVAEVSGADDNLRIQLENSVSMFRVRIVSRPARLVC